VIAAAALLRRSIIGAPKPADKNRFFGN